MTRGRLFTSTYLSDDALTFMKNYKYKPGSYTLMDKAFTPFWDHCVTWLPVWMAPNLVTFSGLLFLIVGHASIMVHNQAFNAELVPGWAFAVFALCLFIYQTMDAIDGKQARRLGEGSPLGQLFDHGCDALLLGLAIIANVTATNLHFPEDFPWAVATVVLSFAPFALCTLEEYHTGVLQTGNSIVGVTEGQVSSIIIHGLSAIFGGAFWNMTAFSIHFGQSLFAIQFKHCISVFGIGNFIWLSVQSVRNLIAIDPSALAADERGQKSLQQGSQFAHMAPFLAWLACSCFWAFAPTRFAQQHPLVWAYLCALSGSFIITKLIVMHMSKQPFTVGASLGPVLVAAIYSWTLPLWNGVYELQVTYGLLAILLGMYLHFVTIVIDQIAAKLDKNCFTVDKVKAR